LQALARRSIMAVSQKQKSKKKEEVREILYKHGEMTVLPMDLIEPNPWNPNEMTAEEFNMLSENIDEVDFLDPILVVPIRKEDGSIRYRIVDGEHRFEQQRLMDRETIKCVVADPDKFDETTQKFQTVRMNKIRGSFSRKKFTQLVEDLMQDGQYSLQDLAHNLGFTDDDEFESLVESARDSLPTDEMKEEFDKARDEIKTVDDLTNVLNRLFTTYGDTLPYNFMILDFGGKDHIWVRMKRKQLKRVQEVARESAGLGVTFDSVIARLLSAISLSSFVERYRDRLETVEMEEK